MSNQMVERGYLTQSLGSASHSGEHGFKAVPGLLKLVLENRAWLNRIIVETGEEFEGFKSFEEYVKANPPKGLGTSIAVIKRIVGEENQELLDAIDIATQRPAGGDKRSEHAKGNIIGLNQSNDIAKRDRSEQIRRRLRKDFPELHKRVLSCEVTETAAAIEAKIYPPRIAVNLRDAESAAKTLLTHASPEFITELKRLLNDGQG
jgi:hypothetical protein